jgi:hypothetical protein
MTFQVNIPDRSVIEKLLMARPPVFSPLLDEVLPAPRWRAIPSSTITVDITSRNITNVPQVRPGGPGYVQPADGTVWRTYAPNSIRLVDHLDGATVNRLKDLEPGYLASEKAEKYQNMRDNMRLTREAMLARALYGTYTYFVNQALGIALDTTTIGNVADGTVTTPFNNVAAVFASIRAAWDEMKLAMKLASNGRFGNADRNLVCYLGDDSWVSFLELVGASTLLNTPQAADGVWSAFGMRFRNISGSYTTYVNGGTASAPYITAHTAVMVDLSGGHMGRYLSVDDLAANLAPSEFFAKEWEQEDPSGLHLLSEQKPFIFPDTRAISVCPNIME